MLQCSSVLLSFPGRAAVISKSARTVVDLPLPCSHACSKSVVSGGVIISPHHHATLAR
jgi:hypothetical protein